LNPEWAERILSWRHSGFNVHSRVRARTRREAERMDYMEFIARVTSHIPDKGQVMVRYYGLYFRTPAPEHPPADSQAGSISGCRHPPNDDRLDPDILSTMESAEVRAWARRSSRLSF